MSGLSQPGAKIRPNPKTCRCVVREAERTQLRRPNDSVPASTWKRQLYASTFGTPGRSGRHSPTRRVHHRRSGRCARKWAKTGLPYPFSSSSPAGRGDLPGGAQEERCRRPAPVPTARRRLAVPSRHPYIHSHDSCGARRHVTLSPAPAPHVTLLRSGV